MNTALISVIVPVYNASKFLSNCLDSILGQTYTNLDVICVNDGSTDNSLALLENYACSDARLKIIDIENGGVSNARNVALSHAKGDQVMFVDADDWLEDNCLERLMDFKACYGCDIVMFPYKSERDNVSLKRDLFSCQKVFRERECTRLARLLIGPTDGEIVSPTKLDSYGTIWGKLYDRELLSGLSFVGLDKIGTAEDSLFNMFAFKRAHVIGYYPDVYYHYRRSNDLSLTNRVIPQLKDKWKYMFSIIADNFTNEDEKEALSNRTALGVLGLLINAYDSDSYHKDMLAILNDETYNTALQKLNMGRLPLHWRVFYFLAEKRQVRLIELLLFCIQIIRRRTVGRINKDNKST